MRLGFFHQLYHAPKSCVGANARNLHAQCADARNGCGIHVRAGGCLNRQGFAGDGSLVDSRLPGEHQPVHWNLVTGPDDYRFANLQRANGNFLLHAIAFHPGGLRRERAKFFYRPARTFRGKCLGVGAHAHEENNHSGGCPLANRQRGQHAHGHQRMRDNLAPNAGAHHLAEDGPATYNHNCKPGPKRHEPGQLANEAKPFANHNDEQRHPKRKTQLRADAARKIVEQRRLCCGWHRHARRHTIARALNGCMQCVHFHARGIQPDDRFFRG